MDAFPSRLRNGLFAVVALTLLGGCASGPEIRSDTNPTANLADHSTFAFFSPLATDSAGYETVFTGRLKDSTRRALETKGYIYSESAPDLLVNFYANVQDKQDIRSTPVSTGYYGYRRGFYGGIGSTEIETVNYKQGTLTIDLVDASKKTLAWQATAEGRVSQKARKNPGPAIDAVVRDMITALPARASPAP